MRKSKTEIWVQTHFWVGSEFSSQVKFGWEFPHSRLINTFEVRFFQSKVFLNQPNSPLFSRF